MKKLLFHICCAPDAVTGFERLKSKFDITGVFYNPNIEPIEEHTKREKASNKLSEKYEIDYIPAYGDSLEWYNMVKEFADEPEGGERCKRCIRFRLEWTAIYAVKKDFDAFSTSLTTSPHKDVDFIHSVGKKLGEKYGLHYIAETLRKNGGFQLSLELCKKHDIYRQDYCGCSWSFRGKQKTLF